jgi:hypothetical protein
MIRGDDDRKPMTTVEPVFPTVAKSVPNERAQVDTWAISTCRGRKRGMRGVSWADGVENLWAGADVTAVSVAVGRRRSVRGGAEGCGPASISYTARRFVSNGIGNAFLHVFRA